MATSTKSTAYKELSKEIIMQMGGKSNITQAWHCFTRLRFNVADKSKVNVDTIKKLDGVMGTQFQGDQFQVIIGNDVANVYNFIKDEVGELDENSKTGSSVKNNPVTVVFETIAGIFTPVLPAIVGAGLLKGFLNLFVILGWMTEGQTGHLVLTMISDAAFTFLPFLLAFSCAKRFKTNEYLAVSLAGILMYPSFVALDGQTLHLFGVIPLKVIGYASSVIPIILSVMLLSVVYKFIRDVLPNVLKGILAPVLSLLIVAPIMLIVLGPIGSVIGEILAKVFGNLFEHAGPIAGFLFAGLMPFITMAGMHYAFFPVMFSSFANLGYDIMLLPMSLVNNFAQFGAVLAVAVKTRNSNLRSIAASSSVSAAFGITEPAMYGVNMKLKKPMYAAMIGSALGGMLYGLFNVKTYVNGYPNFMLFPGFVEPGVGVTRNLIVAVIGVLVSVSVAFVITFITHKDEKEEVIGGSDTDQKAVIELKNTTILAPISGKAIPLSQVEDEVFATEVLGKGIGIVPTSNIVKAPFDGEVSMITDTKHAVGLLSNDGAELLVHVGINTVSLNGEGFEMLLSKGEKFKKGQNILKFDPTVIDKNNLSSTTVVVVTNTESYSSIECVENKDVVSAQDQVLKLTL